MTSMAAIPVGAGKLSEGSDSVRMSLNARAADRASDSVTVLIDPLEPLTVRGASGLEVWLSSWYAAAMR